MSTLLGGGFPQWFHVNLALYWARLGQFHVIPIVDSVWLSLHEYKEAVLQDGNPSSIKSFHLPLHFVVGAVILLRSQDGMVTIPSTMLTVSFAQKLVGLPA